MNCFTWKRRGHLGLTSESKPAKMYKPPKADRLFYTDGLIIGIEIFVYKDDSGRYVLTEIPDDNYDKESAKFAILSCRTQTVVARRLEEPIHDEIVQVARLRTRFYDEKWRFYG